MASQEQRMAGWKSYGTQRKLAGRDVLLSYEMAGYRLRTFYNMVTRMFLVNAGLIASVRHRHSCIRASPVLLVTALISPASPCYALGLPSCPAKCMSSNQSTNYCCWDSPIICIIRQYIYVEKLKFNICIMHILDSRSRKCNIIKYNFFAYVCAISNNMYVVQLPIIYAGNLKCISLTRT
jgi:hypothetical protein